MEVERKINLRSQASHKVHHPVHVSGLDLPANIKYEIEHINFLKQANEKIKISEYYEYKKAKIG